MFQFYENHFSQKRPIQQFIHNIEHDIWTPYGHPAQEFLLGIDFDNTAYEDSGVQMLTLGLSPTSTNVNIGLKPNIYKC